MIKETALLLIMSLGFILSTFTFACSSSDDKQQSLTQEGMAPILATGDIWIQGGFNLNDVEYTKTVKIIGEDNVQEKECYIAEVTHDPPIIPNAIAAIEKSNMDILRIQASGEFNEMPFSSDTIYTYTYSEPQYPIYVGKTWEETKTIETITTMLGETGINTSEEKINYKVESLDEVVVPADSFTCFRIVSHDNDGQKLHTYWYSNMVKSNVKIVNHETGETVELLSYSVIDQDSGTILRETTIDI